MQCSMVDEYCLLIFMWKQLLNIFQNENKLNIIAFSGTASNWFFLPVLIQRVIVFIHVNLSEDVYGSAEHMTNCFLE